MLEKQLQFQFSQVLFITLMSDNGLVSDSFHNPEVSKKHKHLSDTKIGQLYIKTFSSQYCQLGLIWC